MKRNEQLFFPPFSVIDIFGTQTRTNPTDEEEGKEKKNSRNFLYLSRV